MKNPRYPIIVVDDAKDVIVCVNEKEAISIPDGDEWTIEQGVFEIYDSLGQKFKYTLSDGNRIDMIYVEDVEKEEIERKIKSYLTLVGTDISTEGYGALIDSLIEYQEKKRGSSFLRRVFEWIR